MPVPMICFTCSNPLFEKYEHFLNLVKDDKFKNSLTETELNESIEYNALAFLCIWKDCCRQYYLTINNMDSILH